MNDRDFEATMEAWARPTHHCMKATFKWLSVSDMARQEGMTTQAIHKSPHLYPSRKVGARAFYFPTPKKHDR